MDASEPAGWCQCVWWSVCVCVPFFFNLSCPLADSLVVGLNGRVFQVL